MNGNYWVSQYKSIGNMLGHLERQKSNSTSSKRIHCYEVYRLCVKNDMNPDQLIKQGRRNVENMVQSFANEIFDRTNSPAYANTVLYRLKLFFSVNGFDRNRELVLKRFFQAPRSRKRPEYIPTVKEALAMADHACSLRDRVLIQLLTFTGFRINTALAIKISDFGDELNKGLDNVLIRVDPDKMKEVNPNAAKNRIPYYVFAIKFLVNEIRLYLKDRYHNFGSADNDEVLFPTTLERLNLRNRLRTSIAMESASRIVKEAARRAGVARWKDVHPHCLRKTYESHFLSKQPSGLLTQQDERFFMGWLLPGAQDTYFDKDKIEEMRAKWSRFIIPGVDDHKTSPLVQEVAGLFDIDYQQLKDSLKNELGREPTPDEERILLKKKLKDIIKTQSEEPTPRIRQIIVHRNELESWLKKGALYKDKIDDRVIIELREAPHEGPSQSCKIEVKK